MLEIIYQDEHIVAVNKPAGWLVHRSWLDRNETVFVMQTVRDQIGQHVYTVHRLDRPTSGVLLMALSSDVARMLSLQFEQHQIQKTYHAVVRGYVLEGGTVDYAMAEELDKIADKFAKSDKAPQPSVSHYEALAQVEVPLAIGRYETARYSLVALNRKRVVSTSCVGIWLISVTPLLVTVHMVIYVRTEVSLSILVVHG